MFDGKHQQELVERQVFDIENLRSMVAKHLEIPIEDVSDVLCVETSMDLMSEDVLHKKMYEIELKRIELERIEHTTKYGKYWEKVSISGEEFRALRSEVYLWRQNFKERLLTLESESGIDSYASYVKKCGGDASKCLVSLIRGYTWDHGITPYNYSHYDGRPESVRALGNINALTRKLANDPESDYLLSVVSAIYDDRSSQGVEWWNDRVGTLYKYLPFRICPDRYAIVVPYKGQQEIVLSDKADFDQITSHKKKLDSIQPELQRVREQKAKLFEEFSHMDVDMWPQDVLEQRGSTTKIERMSDQLSKDLVSFFKASEDGEVAAGRSDDIDESKRLSIDDVSTNSEADLMLKEKLADNLRFLYTVDAIPRLGEDLGIEFGRLSLPEQFNLLGFLRSKARTEVESIKGFLNIHGYTGIRTLLSLERGGLTLGDSVISFGAHYEEAGRVFDYYCQLLDAAEQAEELVLQATNCEGALCAEITAQVRENILNRAQIDLERAVRADNPTEVEAIIEHYIADAKVHVALLQEATREPLPAISLAELSGEDREQIRVLSQNNYQHESPEFQQLIASGLEAAFQSPYSRFYVEKDPHGTVIFCDRFDDQQYPETGERVLYFGSVNAEPAFNGVGRVRINETLNTELAAGTAMYAHCDPENPVSSMYIEHGFVATHTVSPAGKFSFEIWRSSNTDELLRTKTMTSEELLSYVNNQEPEREFTVRAVQTGDQFPELQQGQYLTRYFKHQGTRYAVFEPAPPELKEEFIAPEEK